MNASFNKARCAVIEHWGKIVSFALVAVLIGLGGQLVLGRTQVPTVLAFGGNQDFSSTQFVGQLDGTGRSNGYRVIPVAYNADIGQGQASIDSGLAAGKAAWNENCASGCELWGFSWGTEVALQLAGQFGVPGDKIQIHGGPQQASGIFHHWGVVSGVPPFQVEFWLNAFGRGLPTNTIPPAGTKAFGSTADAYFNAAPQCGNPAALGALQLNEHAIQPPGGERIWVDRFGVEMHEFDVGANPTIASGADPTPFWQGCPWFDWNKSEAFDGSQGLPGMYPPFPNGTQAAGQSPLPLPGG